MSVVWTIVLVIVMFGLMISLHELGHFLVAKACHITVHEFSIGMGPQIVAKEKNGTKYALRLLPIGGYVSMEGEDGESDDPHSFVQQKPWKRAAVLCAGAGMNILLGFLTLIVYVSLQSGIGTTTVAWFSDDAMSSQTGLQIGDTIKKVDDTAIWCTDDLSYALGYVEDGTADFVVERDGERITLSNVTFALDEDNALVLDFKVLAVSKNPWTVVKEAGLETVYSVKLVWRSLCDLVTGHIGITELSGPVGVAEAVHTYAVDIDSILWMFALLTVNVGIFNILPLPALDGGRLLFVIIEWICRHPVKRSVEAAIHAVGMMLLFLLMIVVTVKDVLNLF